MSSSVGGERPATTLITREHITCDGPGCEAPSPSNRCAKCKCVFYCSTQCQKKHWKEEHKRDCRNVELIRAQMVDVTDSSSSANPTTTTTAAINTSCFICLSEPISDPYVIPGCGHAFCFGCLRKWQGFVKAQARSVDQQRSQPSSVVTSCPACRAAAPDVEQSMLEKAFGWAQRANRSNIDEVEKTELREKAMVELGKAAKSTDKQTEMNALYATADILLSLERPHEAVNLLEGIIARHEMLKEKNKRFDELFRQADDPNIDEDEYDRVCDEMSRLANEKDESIVIQDDALEIHLSLANCKEAICDWEGAKEIYISKMLAKTMDTESVVGTPAQNRRMWMGLSCCFYHLGDYEKAIHAGEAAIQMNRHFPQVHKYVALSQKASGDLEAARKTMARAVTYETPWDDENRKEVMKMYREMMTEEVNSSGAY